MTKRLTIQGLGLVGGFGCGAEALRRALCPPRPGQPPPPLQAPPVDVSRLERLVERKSLRRIDHFSRLALLGAFLALEDAAALTTPRDRMALILATGYGAAQTTFAFQDSYLDHGDRCASPTHFSTSVHNVAAAGIAITLGLPGPVLTVSQFELSTVSALLTASQWLATGRVDRVLFGNVDECCPVLEYGWERLREPDPTAAIPAGHQLRRPPGEGAAFFLLARDDATAPYGGVTDLHLGRLAAGTPPCPPASRIILNDQRTLWPHHPAAPLPAGLNHAVSYEPVYGRLPVGPAFDLAIAALTLQAEAAEPAAAPRPITCLTLARDQAFGRIICQRDR